jgi:hypothetical protein
MTFKELDQAIAKHAKQGQALASAGFEETPVLLTTVVRLRRIADVAFNQGLDNIGAEASFAAAHLETLHKVETLLHE